MKPLDPTQILPAAGTANATAAVIDKASENIPAHKATLLLIAALTIMSGATIAPSLPAIEAHFASAENAGLLTRLVLTLPALFIAFCAPFAGGLADRFGRRPLLIGSVVLYGFAGISGLALTALNELLIGRALLGVAVAGTMTTATALVGDYFSGPERDRFMGLQAAFIGVGGLIFLTSGGLLADFHWRAPFAVYGLAFMLLPAVILFINEPSRAPSAPAMVSNPSASGRPQAMMALLFAVAILNSAIFYLIPTQLPFYLQSLGIEAPSRAGLAIGLLNLGSTCMALAYAWVRQRAGISGMFAIGFALMAIGYWLVAAAGSYAIIVLAIAITGIGMGAIMPNLMAGTMLVAPAEFRGRAAGGLTASIFLGQFLSPLVSQPWIESFGFAAAFRDMGLLLAATAVAAAAAAAYLAYSPNMTKAIDNTGR
jgi:MFS family permease